MEMLFELMRGAGLGDMMAPKSDSMKEHERLVALLGDPVSGGSNKSNFIARLMAEQKYKHATGEDRKPAPYRPGRKKGRKTPNPTKGEYRKPVMDPLYDKTDMNAPIKFDYSKLAFKRQDPRGRKKTDKDKHEYGASPFITHHFGNARSEAKAKEDAVQAAARRFFSGKAPKAEKEEEEEEEEEETEAERKERAKEKRKESLEEFRRKRADQSIPDRLEKDLRKPESIKRAERKARQLAKLTERQKEQREIADAARKPSRSGKERPWRVEAEERRRAEIETRVRAKIREQRLRRERERRENEDLDG
jgi:hypothetical protein